MVKERRKEENRSCLETLQTNQHKVCNLICRIFAGNLVTCANQNLVDEGLRFYIIFIIVLRNPLSTSLRMLFLSVYITTFIIKLKYQSSIMRLLHCIDKSTPYYFRYIFCLDKCEQKNTTINVVIRSLLYLLCFK